MELNDFKEAMRLVVEDIPQLQTFIFDDIEAVNLKRDKSYPILLMKIPQGEIPQWGKFSKELYNIDFYCLDLFHKSNPYSKEQIFDQMKLRAITFIDKVFKKHSPTIAPISRRLIINFGEQEGVDNLIGVRVQTQWQVFNKKLC